MQELSYLNSETIIALLEKAKADGVDRARILISNESFKIDHANRNSCLMAEAICNWLLDDANGKQKVAVQKFQSVKKNIMLYLNLVDPSYFSLAFETLCINDLKQAFVLADSLNEKYIAWNFLSFFPPS